MAISQVRANVDGTWYTLTYDSESGAYKATITAPGATSFNKTGGYYDIQVQATNTAGTTATVSGASLNGLRLVVKERVAPVITIISPSSGAYVTNNKQPIVCNVVDEVNGSGIDTNSIVVKVDGTVIPHTTTAITNGYAVTATPTDAMTDGNHTVTVDVSDNDGNAADQKSTTFMVDTVPPTLNVTAPTDGFITNNPSLILTGTTNDSTSSPVTISVSLNGIDQGVVTVAADGSFSKVITLAAQINTIEVTATDTAGKSSTVTRTVELDTDVPEIVSATVTPNPADAGATVIISVVVNG